MPTLTQFFQKQLIDVIQWNEPEEGVLAYRYPMVDMEIQNGGQLTVRESEMAAFVQEGEIADVFGPGLHTLTTRNLPLLTDLRNWDKGFQSPFKSDVYFFSTRLQIDQKWGTGTPITVRDKEFGAVRLRCYGVYSYRIADPRTFFKQISGTRDTYRASELEGQLRDTIVARMTEIFATSEFSYLDMTAHQSAFSEKMLQQATPAFAALGLELNQFLVENISLPDELQRSLDQRIGMNIVGDLDRFTQFSVAQSLSIAAANAGTAGMGMGFGVGAALAQTISGTLKAAGNGSAGLGSNESPADQPAAIKFCASCGNGMARQAKFCSECGTAQ